MIKIGIQNKTTAKKGIVSTYLFENKSINLKPTLFHKIEIPLTPFDSGLDYIEQPENTSIVFDWFELNLENIKEIEGQNFTSINYPNSEVTIYIGSAHNWCRVMNCEISKLNYNSFLFECSLYIEFENVGVAKNESFSFKTEISFEK